MPDQFDDALERLDFDFTDFNNSEAMLARLRSLLKVSHVSPLQRQIAADKARRDQAEIVTGALERGLSVRTQQTRAGAVLQLRVAGGRFGAFGLTNIRAFFAANPV